MGFAEARAQLEARQPEHMPGPSLDRIRELVNYLDHPELTYPTIHVTGTNGKTTAARVTGAVGCAYGLTAGVFTSPHLLSVTERFSICGVDMTEQEFADEWAHLEPFLQLVDGLGSGEVTYFEAVTALAYLWFADRPVGLGVFEVGMGGSWDATNLVTGDVAVITPVGLDHVAELGPTLADIAAEKAGILKPGRTGVIRAQDPEVAVVLARKADEVGAVLLHEGADWEVEEELLAVGGQSFRVRGIHATYEDLYLPLLGAYSVANAAAGVVAVEVLAGQALDEATVRKGLREVRSPGRLEVVGREPLVLLDGAHNPAGAGALAEALERAFSWDR
ncbi:MAG: bifunctional folylpolyglutamate synthase/dihydrofolate synthase, partial [Actinomycetota bacterium]